MSTKTFLEIVFVVFVLAGIVYLFAKYPPGTGEENSMKKPELVIEDIVSGNGAEAVDGKIIVVHYTGTLSDGTVFDSSVPRGVPLSFILGKGEVIRGWEEGIRGMKVGGKRKLTIPPELAYGENGFPPVIPPNAVLTFEVELLDIQ